MIRRGDSAPRGGIRRVTGKANSYPWIALAVSCGGKDMRVEVTLAHKLQRSFKIVPIANPDALQAAILKDWMRAK
jgi:hypothetical protein